VDHRAQVIDQPRNAMEQWLVETVRRHATKAGIGMPQVAVYEGEPMPSPPVHSRTTRSSPSLPACCIDEQGRGGGGTRHEIGHVANGDMVTMTLIREC